MYFNDNPKINLRNFRTSIKKYCASYFRRNSSVIFEIRCENVFTVIKNMSHIFQTISEYFLSNIFKIVVVCRNRVCHYDTELYLTFPPPEFTDAFQSISTHSRRYLRTDVKWTTIRAKSVIQDDGQGCE